MCRGALDRIVSMISAQCIFLYICHNRKAFMGLPFIFSNKRYIPALSMPGDKISDKATNYDKG